MSDPNTVTEPVTSPDPEQESWDAQGERLAAEEPRTVTSEEPAVRGGQHPV